MSSAFMEAGIPLSNLLIMCVMSVVTLKFTFSTLFMNLYSTDSEKNIYLLNNFKKSDHLYF